MATAPTAPIRSEPFSIAKFLVTIDGIASTSFTEVSGLETSIDVIDYRSGDSKLPVDQKLPGLSRVSNVVLKRGLTTDMSLFNWITSAMAGNLIRSAVKITLLDQSERPVLAWRLHNAWPCKWSGPTLCSTSSEVAIETLELTHEGLDFITAG